MAAEIALSCILLVSSVLMIRSVVNLNSRPLGIENTNLLTGRIGIPEAQYPDGESVCPKDGASLLSDPTQATDPRLVAGTRVGEYVVEQVLGTDAQAQLQEPHP